MHIAKAFTKFNKEMIIINEAVLRWHAQDIYKKKKKNLKNLYINIAYVKVSKLTFRDGN